MLAQLYSRPGFLLRRAHQISVAIFEDCCKSLNLSPSQYAVLAVLQEYPSANQNQLARALGMSKVTISQTVKILEERILIRREADVDDKRLKALQLTDAGRQLLRLSEPCTEESFQRLMQPLNVVERETFLKLLKRVALELESQAKVPFEPAVAG